NDVGSTIRSISRLNHAAYLRPVYASQPGSRLHRATLGSGWWLAFCRSGTSTRRVPLEAFRQIFLHMTFCSSRLGLAHLPRKLFALALLRKHSPLALPRNLPPRASEKNSRRASAETLPALLRSIDPRVRSPVASILHQLSPWIAASQTPKR